MDYGRTDEASFAASEECVTMSITRKQFLLSATSLAVTSLWVACGGTEDKAASTTDAGPDGHDASSDADDGATDGSEGYVDASRAVDADGGDEAGKSSCLDNGTSPVISSNHGHVLVISKDDVAAGVEQTYSILGTATHSHDVTLTAAHFAELSQNLSVTLVSTAAETHTHTITVTCA